VCVRVFMCKRERSREKAGEREGDGWKARGGGAKEGERENKREGMRQRDGEERVSGREKERGGTRKMEKWRGERGGKPGRG